MRLSGFFSGDRKKAGQAFLNLVIYGLPNRSVLTRNRGNRAVGVIPHYKPKRKIQRLFIRRTRYQVSQSIRIAIVRLCKCLIYMVVVRLCPAVRKRACGDGVAVELIARVEAADAREASSGAISIFGKFISSIPAPAGPFNCADAFVFDYQDHLVELGTKQAAEESEPVAEYMSGGKPLKTGFDLIRLTLNLARGNLEGSSFAVAIP